MKPVYNIFVFDTNISFCKEDSQKKCEKLEPKAQYILQIKNSIIKID